MGLRVAVWSGVVLCLALLEEGGCPAGVGAVMCLDVPDDGVGSVTVLSMVWEPGPGVSSAVIEVGVSDDLMDEFGFEAAGGTDPALFTINLAAGE